MIPTQAEFEYIVVGGGSAGVVVASRLASAGHDVCLIEAGRRSAPAHYAVPVFSAFAATDPHLQWGIAGGPEASLNQRKLALAQARVLGGGSTINAMIYTRGHSSEYDAWGCPGWTFKDLLPFYKKSERSSRGENHWHGASGPLSVVQGSAELEIDRLFMDAAFETGHRVVDDLNADVTDGFASFDYTIKNGRRAGVVPSFLANVTRRVTVYPDSPVQRVKIERGRAVGVEVRRGSGLVTVSASREVIISAGAINSPALLMRSGIGSADHLREHGLGVVLDAPEVGNNLQNHVRYMITAFTEGVETAFTHLRPMHAMGDVFAYAFGRQGMWSQPPFSVGGYIKTDEALPLADVKVTLGRGVAAPGRVIPRSDGFSVMLHQGRPASRGTVRLGQTASDLRPTIETNYLSEEIDLGTLSAGISRVREILSAPVLRKRAARSSIDDMQDEDVVESIRRTAAGIFHPAGTCRMGADNASVVDLQLRVRGIDGLRVADCSIIPQLMSVNTNAPAIMIGERAASLIASV